MNSPRDENSFEQRRRDSESTQEMKLSCGSSHDTLQKGFDEELALETLSSHSTKCAIEYDGLSRALSDFNRVLAIDDFESRTSSLSLPSPNDMRTDIISLWEEVSANMEDPVFSRSQLPEPARRASIGEQMPPPRRYHAYAWIAMSRKLFQLQRQRLGHSASVAGSFSGSSGSPSSPALTFDLAIPWQDN
jgi:hypothetical protein